MLQKMRSETEAMLKTIEPAVEGKITAGLRKLFSDLLEPSESKPAG
jgi:hypothetical protein